MVQKQLFSEPNELSKKNEASKTELQVCFQQISVLLNHNFYHDLREWMH